MASGEDSKLRIQTLEEPLKPAQARVEQAQARADQAEKQLAETMFSDFLHICHTDVFLQIKVQRNSLLATTGGLSHVNGKYYPHHLKPWSVFDSLGWGAFALLRTAFGQRELFPPALRGGLEYLASKYWLIRSWLARKTWKNLSV